MAKFSGSCLCGAVRYESDADAMVAGHCHCIDCRKSGGTGHCSHLGLPEAGFNVTGELRFFDAPADSGNIVSRGFCPTCGSPIYSTNSAMKGALFVRASSLDDPELFNPQVIVFTKRAPSWDTIPGSLPSFEGMPPQMPV
jgi:hypothetical protein